MEQRPSHLLTAGSLWFCVFGLCACATTGPMQKRREALDSRIQTNRTAPFDLPKTGELEPIALAQWRAGFEDPVLTALIADALDHNTDTRSALFANRQARAQRGLNAAHLPPSINGNVSASGSRARDRTKDSSTSSGSLSAGIDACWQIDLFGRQGKNGSPCHLTPTHVKEGLE